MHASMHENVQTDRQTDRQTERQTDKQKYMHDYSEVARRSSGRRGGAGWRTCGGAADV